MHKQTRLTIFALLSDVKFKAKGLKFNRIKLKLYENLTRQEASKLAKYVMQKIDRSNNISLKRQAAYQRLLEIFFRSLNQIFRESATRREF